MVQIFARQAFDEKVFEEQNKCRSIFAMNLAENWAKNG